MASHAYKLFKLQLLHSIKDGHITLFTRWGIVSENGKMKSEVRSKQQFHSFNFCGHFMFIRIPSQGRQIHLEP